MSNTNPAYPATTAGARRFFAAALALVESASIRSWATSAHNRPIWENEAFLRLKAGRKDSTTLATSIVAHAMGL